MTTFKDIVQNVLEAKFPTIHKSDEPSEPHPNFHGPDWFKRSLWHGTARNQSTYTRLQKKLVPFSGRAKTEHGELLRAIGRIYHDLYNNGFGNGPWTDEWNTIRRHEDKIKKYMANQRFFREFDQEFADIDYGGDYQADSQDWEGAEPLEDIAQSIVDLVDAVDTGADTL